MRIALLAPGTGGFYCGSCMRDHALFRGLWEAGHDAVLVPLYLPIITDEGDTRDHRAIHLGGVNMYLQQVSRVFRHTPRFVDRIFDSRPLLGYAARRATMTQPEDLGPITKSMLRGESGRQVKEVRRLADGLAQGAPFDVICLSNLLLVGLARELRDRLGPVPIVSTAQGEDAFLDSLPEPHRSEAWEIVSRRCEDLAALLPVSRYYADVMTERLSIQPERVHPVWNGVTVDDFRAAPEPPSPPVIGFLARMTETKGLETLVEAFLKISGEDRVPAVRLHVAGTWTPADRELTDRLERTVDDAGLTDRVTFSRDVSRDEKIEFLSGLSVLSVPAVYGEAFGLYVIEAWAAGVPVVQPRHGAFPELIDDTGGGVLYDPDGGANALANALTDLLRDPARARALGAKGREATQDRFTVSAMTERVLTVFRQVAPSRSTPEGE